MRLKKKFFILLIIMILIFLSPQLIRQVKSTFIIEERDLMVLEEIETGYDKDVIYKKLASDVIQYWDGILFSYDVTGKQKWNLYLGVLNPFIQTNDDSVYILDNQKNQIIRVSKHGEILYRYNTQEALTNFKLCKDNYVILQYPSKGNLTNLKILDEEGREYSSILLTEGKVINISISKENNYVGINTITTNNSLESRLLTYDIEGRLIGSNNLGEELVLEILYDSKGNMIIIKEEEIFSINKNNDVMWSIPLDKIKLLDVNLPQHIIVYSGIKDKNPFIHTGKKENVKILGYNGKVFGKAQLGEIVKGIDSNDEGMVFYSTRSFYLLDKKGNLKMEHKYFSDIEEIFVFPKDYIVIVTRGKVSFMKIKER